MAPMKKAVLLVGSYNGQDSFGDKYLLKCVCAQFCLHFGSEVRFISHLHELSDELADQIEGIQFTKGLSVLFWGWHNKLRHLRAPGALHVLLAILSLPLFLVATRDNRAFIARVWREIGAAKLLYFYGGTQLSQQWFWLNFIPLVLTLVLCRVRGVPVYFGPQQYGPQQHLQRLCFRLAVRCLVQDARARNRACLELIGKPESALLLDEVYSCTVRYPIMRSDRRPRSYLLINMRAGNFLRDGTPSDFFAFGDLLLALYQRLGLPYKLFHMSGSSFSDDTRMLAHLTDARFHDISVEVLPPHQSEEELIALAQGAYGMVSMSFHGCILSMIGGCPAVPVSSGQYYDYKYIDFDRYTGGQAVPVVYLDGIDASAAADVICAYFDRYQSDQTAESRKEAAQAMEQWYARLQ